MQIELSTEQLERLAKMAYAGHFVMSETLLEEENDEDYDETLQLILKKLPAAKKFSRDKETGDVTPSREWENTVIRYLEAYDQSAFWGELSYSLAERDLLMEITESSFGKLSDEERLQKLSPRMEQYDREFEGKGVSRLFLKE